MSTLKYRKEIDGLRAFAVIPVILYHLNGAFAPGGYSGVDVFFVISGFLITSIILKENDNSTFSFKNFWSRRAKRILPALLTMIAATLFAGSLILYPTDANTLSTHSVAALLSISNVSHWLLSGSYWGESAENSPLLHTWSLSVEEQFYLIFPALLIFILKRHPNKTLLSIGILSLISAVLYLVGKKSFPDANFYLLPTRIWELGSGALLAIFLFGRAPLTLPNKYQFTLPLAFLLLIASFVLKNVSSFLFLPVLACIWIIAFGWQQGSLVNRILSAKTIVYIGTISYSLYLWHWPIIVLSEEWALQNGKTLNPIILILMTIVASAMSYHLIEKPLRHKAGIIPYLLISLVALAFASMALKKQAQGIDTPYTTNWYGQLYNVAPRSVISEERMDGITIHEPDSALGSYSTGIKKNYSGEKADILVFGDSHGLMWAKLLDEIAAEEKHSIQFFTADATNPFFTFPLEHDRGVSLSFSKEELIDFHKAKLKAIEENQPKLVILSSRWSQYQNIYPLMPLVNHLEKLGIKILLIGQPPELPIGNKNAPKYFHHLGMKPERSKSHYIYEKAPEVSSVLSMLKESCSSCFILETRDIFQKENDIWVIDDYSALYIDDDHLSHEGALKAKSQLKKSMQTLLNK